MKKTTALFLFLLLSASFAVANPSQAVQLRYNFVSGSNYNYGLRLNADMKILIKSSEQTQPLSAKLNGYTDIMQSIDKVTDNNTAIITTGFDNIQGKISFTGIGQEMSLPVDMVKKIQEIINPVTVEMDRRGKILSISMPSLDKFLQEIAKQKRPLPSNPLAEINKRLTESPSPLPEGDIQSGHTWNSISKLVLPDGKTVEITVHNTFKGITEVDGKNCYIIENTMNLPLGAFLPVSVKATKDMQLDGSISMKTLIHHEASSMMIMHMDSSLDIKMNMGISDTMVKIDAVIKVLMNRR
ncbi:MAG: hypothetical protein ACOX1G_02860 [bacterium]|jgi:hypothetical protein